MYDTISALALIELWCYCCAGHLDHDQQLYALVSQQRLKDLKQIMLSRIPNALHHSTTKAQSRLPENGRGHFRAHFFPPFFVRAKMGEQIVHFAGSKKVC